MFLTKSLIENVKKKKLFVFDFDGVVLDSVDVKGEVFYQIYESYGKGVASAAKLYHLKNGGVPRNKKFEHLHSKLLNYQLCDEELSLLSRQFSRLAFQKLECADEIPGIRMFLDYLKSDTKLCTINSAAPADDLAQILTRRNLIEYFGGIFGSEESKIENLRVMQKKFDFLPGDIIFFGDTKNDKDAAEAVGIDFISVRSNDLGCSLGGNSHKTSLHDFRELL